MAAIILEVGLLISGTENETNTITGIDRIALNLLYYLVS